MKENEIRVGSKPKSAYLNAILHIFKNNSVSSIHVRGLAGKGAKAIDIAERAEKLVPALDFERIEPISVDGVRGHDAILKVAEGGGGSET